LTTTTSFAIVVPSIAFAVFATRGTGWEEPKQQHVGFQYPADGVRQHGVGLLLACVERVLSSPPNVGSNSGSSTIARSTLTHLAGAGRVNLANYPTCLHRLARVVASHAHPGGQENND
jgi:hypothetical protein